MIDRIISSEGKTTVTGFMVKEENVFCSDGILREPGLIENIAQTAAAGAGIKQGDKDEQPLVGFIGGIRYLTIHSLPRVGDELITKITVEHEVFDATVVNGRIYKEDQIVAECELKIFLIKNNL